MPRRHTRTMSGRAAPLFPNPRDLSASSLGPVPPYCTEHTHTLSLSFMTKQPQPQSRIPRKVAIRPLGPRKKKIDWRTEIPHAQASPMACRSPPCTGIHTAYADRVYIPEVLGPFWKVVPSKIPSPSLSKRQPGTRERDITMFVSGAVNLNLHLPYLPYLPCLTYCAYD